MSKKNLWCRMLGHRYQMALGGFRCARCGHFRESAWAKIPPPPKPPKPVEKRTDYEELWKSSKSVTDIFQSMRLALWGLSTDTCDVMYVGRKYIILDKPPSLLPEQEKVAQLRWSLSRLIALVPKCIITPQGTFNDYLFHISGDFIAYSHEENGEPISNLIFVRCNGDYVSGMISIIIRLIQKGFLDKKYLCEDAEYNVQ